MLNLKIIRKSFQNICIMHVLCFQGSATCMLNLNPSFPNYPDPCDSTLRGSLLCPRTHFHQRGIISSSWKMEVLGLIKKSFADVGIVSNRNSRKSAFNAKSLCCLFWLLMNCSSCFLYVLIEANKFENYVSSCFIASAYSVTTILYYNMIWKTSKIHEFSKNAKDTIEKSKYNTHYLINMQVLLTQLHFKWRTVQTDITDIESKLHQNGS